MAAIKVRGLIQSKAIVASPVGKTMWAWSWVALAAVWAVIIFTTDEGGGPLAIWIAMTLGPIAVLQSRLRNARPDQQSKAAEDST